MAEIFDYDIAAANNNSAPPDGFPEGMNYSAVNNAAREVMAVLARWYGDTNGTLTAAGTATALTLSVNQTVTAYRDGLFYVFKTASAAAGATTISIDGLTAQSIVHQDGTAISLGSWGSGDIISIIYDNANSRFVLLGVTGKLQTQDPTAAGNITGAEVSGHDGALYDVGRAQRPIITTSGTVTLDETHCDAHIIATAALQLTFPQSTDIPVGAYGRIYCEAAVDLVQGTGVTINNFRGSSSVATGNISLSAGGWAFWSKRSATVYDVIAAGFIG